MYLLLSLIRRIFSRFRSADELGVGGVATLPLQKKVKLAFEKMGFGPARWWFVPTTLLVWVACKAPHGLGPEPVHSASAATNPNSNSPSGQDGNQGQPPMVATTRPAGMMVEPLSRVAKTEDERNTISVFRDSAESTVFVTQKRRVAVDFFGNTDEVSAGSGSGFVWDEKGHIVTNFHVVKGATSLTVTFRNQKTYDATVVGVEPRKDVAVIKIDPASLGPDSEAILKPVRVSSTFNLEVGQKTIAIGNPFGLDHTLTTGVVSAVGRSVMGIGGVTIRDMIQTDAAINPGNSGGPLLDSSGFLIGMNTMIFSQSGSSAGIGFAVPASTIARIVPQIVTKGKADQVGIGIELLQRGFEQRYGIRGVVVGEVKKGSPAERAGLKGVSVRGNTITLGDVIVGVDDQKVESYDDLYNAFDKHQAADKVKLKLRRSEKVETVEVELVTLQ